MNKVTLLECTDNPLKSIWARTRGTTTFKGFDKVWETPEKFYPKKVRNELTVVFGELETSTDSFSYEKGLTDIAHNEQLRLVQEALRAGHWSVSRGVSFTFAINCSRNESLQLLRHVQGIAHEQSSMRYVSFTEENYIQKLDTATWEFQQNFVQEKKESLLKVLNEAFVVPETLISAENFLLRDWSWLRLNELTRYQDEIENGIPKEDARDNLPGCARTNLISSFSFEALKNFLAKRLCTRSQSHIRETAKQMRKLAVSKFPWMSEFLTIQCIPTGICPETHYKDCPLICSNGGNILPQELANEVLKEYVKTIKRTVPTKV